MCTLITIRNSQFTIFHFQHPPIIWLICGHYTAFYFLFSLILLSLALDPPTNVWVCVSGFVHDLIADKYCMVGHIDTQTWISILDTVHTMHLSSGHVPIGHFAGANRPSNHPYIHGWVSWVIIPIYLCKYWFAYRENIHKIEGVLHF